MSGEAVCEFCGAPDPDPESVCEFCDGYGRDPEAEAEDAATDAALTAIWAKHDLAQLLTVYEDEIDRSGCFPFQEDREEWDGSGWHAFEIRDEILRRFTALLDERDRLRGALEDIARHDGMREPTYAHPWLRAAAALDPPDHEGRASS